MGVGNPLTSCDAAWWLSSVIDRNQELVQIGLVIETPEAGGGACWLYYVRLERNKTELVAVKGRA